MPQLNPVVPEALDLSGETPALVASRCPDCGTVYYPRSDTCRNPACEGAPQPERIAGEGTLYSYTIQHYKPPDLFGMEAWEPYALGLVDMPHGVRVMGKIAGIPFDALEIGMPVRLSAETLSETDGEALVTHVFRAVENRS